MSNSYLWELVETAAGIVQLDAEESHITDKAEWRAGKEKWDALTEHFGKLRAEYVDALFGDDAPSDGVPDDVQREITSLREECDASWRPAIDYAEANLMPFVKKEAGKDPRVRKALRAAPFVAIPVAMVIYFGVALFSGTPVTEPIETREGIKERAAAAERVIRYDDLMGVRVTKGGWLKGILLWPIEPDAYEIKGAGEFVGLVLEGQQYAKGCGSVTGSGDSLTPAQIKMVKDVADTIRSDDLQWSNPAPLTVVTALERAKSC